MSFDLSEADILEHLDWIDNLSDVAAQEYSKPRYEKSIEVFENFKVITWWEFCCNETTLEEWDQEFHYYEEQKDLFKEWTNRHNIEFSTVSLLRSLHLDDVKSLRNMDTYHYSILRSSEDINFKKLEKALKTLSSSTFEDDKFPEDDHVIVVNDKEFNLRPRITRNLPLRRSTRSGKRSKDILIRGDGTRTMPRQRVDHNNRRLSWETFTFFDRKSQSTGGMDVPDNSGNQNFPNFNKSIAKMKRG